MINNKFKLYVITEEELNQLKLEKLQFEVKEKIDTNEMSVYWIELNDDVREDVEVALEFIRNRTKGYGSVHIMDLCVIPNIRVKSKLIGFKELIRLHKVNSGLVIEKIPFTADKEGRYYKIQFDESNINSIEAITN